MSGSGFCFRGRRRSYMLRLTSSGLMRKVVPEFSSATWPWLADVSFRRALDSPRAAEAAVMRNDYLGPLHGVPISIKSSISVIGMPYEAGTKLRAGAVGETDAPLVSRLCNAGAIVLGVTNTPELLMA